MLFKFNQILMNIFSLDLLCRTQAVNENLKKEEAIFCCRG